MFFVIRTYSCIFVSYWWLFVSFPCKFVHHSYLFRSAVVLSMAFVVVIRGNLAVQSYIFLRHSRSNRDRFFLNLIRGLLVRMYTNINSYCIRLCSWCIFVTVWTGHNCLSKIDEWKCSQSYQVLIQENVTGEFLTQRFSWISCWTKNSVSCQWFETPWCSCNITVMV